jgi:hypothetical protein
LTPMQQPNEARTAEGWASPWEKSAAYQTGSAWSGSCCHSQHHNKPQMQNSVGPRHLQQKYAHETPGATDPILSRTTCGPFSWTATRGPHLHHEEDAPCQYGDRGQDKGRRTGRKRQRRRRALGQGRSDTSEKQNGNTNTNHRPTHTPRRGDDTYRSCPEHLPGCCLGSSWSAQRTR